MRTASQYNEGTQKLTLSLSLSLSHTHTHTHTRTHLDRNAGHELLGAHINAEDADGHCQRRNCVGHVHNA